MASARAPAGEARVPLVSVVIPAYNAQDHLAECVRSVLRQCGEFRLEVVIVDDGSTDRTAAVALGLPDVVCVLQQRNAGPSAARNAGVARTGGEFVAFLDADDLWPEGSLASRLAVLQSLPGAAMVFGDCRQFDDAGPWRETLFASGGLGADTWGRDGTVPNAYALLLQNNFITTGSVLMRRHALVSQGGFAEDLRRVEDLELWLRIARRHSIAWCEALCLQRRRHDHNTSNDAEAMARAYLEVLRRQPPGVHAMAGTGVDLETLVAAQHLELARLAASRGDTAEWRQQARHSLAHRWSWRATWLICLASLGPVAAAWSSRRRGP